MSKKLVDFIPVLLNIFCSPINIFFTKTLIDSKLQKTFLYKWISEL